MQILFLLWIKQRYANTCTALSMMDRIKRVENTAASREAITFTRASGYDYLSSNIASWGGDLDHGRAAAWTVTHVVLPHPRGRSRLISFITQLLFTPPPFSTFQHCKVFPSFFIYTSLYSIWLNLQKFVNKYTGKHPYL
jgi:hypothetical protein